MTKKSFSSPLRGLFYTHHRIWTLATKSICFYNHDRLHTPIVMKIESLFISYTMMFQLKNYKDTPNRFLITPIFIWENTDIELNFSTEIFVLQNHFLQPNSFEIFHDFLTAVCQWYTKTSVSFSSKLESISYSYW